MIPIAAITDKPVALQIAYAIPISIVFNAKDNRVKHTIYENKVPTAGISKEKPLDIFISVVPIISKIIAKERYNQLNFHLTRILYHKNLLAG